MISYLVALFYPQKIFWMSRKIVQAFRDWVMSIIQIPLTRVLKVRAILVEDTVRQKALGYLEQRKCSLWSYVSECSLSCLRTTLLRIRGICS